MKIHVNPITKSIKMNIYEFSNHVIVTYKFLQYILFIKSRKKLLTVALISYDQTQNICTRIRK